MKKLVTERLILREWKESDAIQLHLVCKNQRVGSMAGWKPNDTEDETAALIKKYIEMDQTWAIVLKEGGKLIGCIGISPDAGRHNMEWAKSLAYAIGEEYWGRGYTYEACKEVIRFAFEEINIGLLSAAHFVYNTQSKRVLQKCGFVYEGMRRKAFQRFDGKVLDECIYSMTKEEFLVNRKVNHTGDIQKEMTYSVVRMSRENAYAFLEWRYPAPLDIYTCPPTAYDGKVAQILDKSDGKNYYAVYDSFGDLFGVYEYSFTAEKKLQVEFRIKPEMMGRGFGLSFMRECLRFGMREYSYQGPVVLRVAAQNLRVRQLLEGIGFKENHRDTEIYYGNEIEFIYMELEKLCA